MRRGIWIRLVLILVLAGLAAWLDQPRPLSIGGNLIAIREGLDLQGGTHLVYALDTKDIESTDQDQAHQSVVRVIERRINAFGVSEPLIQPGQIGQTRTVIVELPGVTDVNQAKNLIGKTAQLTFWEQDPAATEQTPLGPGWKKTDLTGAHLRRADYDIETSDSGGGSGSGGRQPIVNLTFNDEGARLFEEITGRNIEKPVAIVLDDSVISAPKVLSKISGGQAVITGVGELKAARDLSIQLNAGALPVPISVIEERTVGATLGTDSVRRSLIAGLIGLIAIIIFMISLYRLMGLLAVIALIIYSLVVFAIFKGGLFWLGIPPITLTLAGIAGLILSIGMAVDANILIFERMKEERRAGRTLLHAIDEGFRRAWPSVRDSNFSSLITCAILIYFGTGLVRGFAITLAIGILISMFTAITVTRTFLKLALRE